MPDITMCQSETCNVRATCYRNEASGTKPTEYRQSWFMEPPGEDDTCPYYWPRMVHSK